MHGRFHRPFADTHGRGEIRVGLRGALAHQARMEFGEKIGFAFLLPSQFFSNSRAKNSWVRSCASSGV
jgi:hypothetical protein